MKKLGLLLLGVNIFLSSQLLAEGNWYDFLVKSDTYESKVYSVKTDKSYNTFNDVSKMIAMDLSKNLSKSVDKENMGLIALTSFVDLNQLNKTTHFGRVMGENLFNELYDYGFKLSDFRGQNALSVNASGEFYITRDVKKLKKSVLNKYILVGTYSKVEEGIIINTRILDNESGEIISTSRVLFRTNDCTLFETCAEVSPRTISIVTDGCSTVKCPENCSDGNCSPLDNK